MKKSILLFMFFIASIVVFAFMLESINSLNKENKRLKSNQEILIVEKESVVAEAQRYKASDSLNAIKVSQLQFTLKEYERYRKDDMLLIKQLNLKNAELKKVITSQSFTINELSAKLVDSIRPGEIDTIKCFNYKSKWTDAHGCIDNDSIELQINNREALTIVESIVYKRFLGFLWKTKKVKSKSVDVVSQNPNTVIISCEYSAIKQ